jgi:diadenosine tetraphosphate (Ap4A) HIT family hydrolase/8-oxo-dGTP pyrophosphatase MutT (NUDIX family)
MQLTPEEQTKQEHYRDARFSDKYDDIWQSVGKCVFCDLREKYVFFEENDVVMTVNIFAYIDGHLMIIPRRHVRSPKELTQLEWDTVRKFSYIAKKLIRDAHGVKGMQFLQKDGSDAQSTVDQHLHFQCIPFDAPDLSVWNYRKLKYTPLENVELYRQARKKIIQAGQKFDKDYRQADALPVICDAVIINEKNEVLLQERSDHGIMIPPHDTLPGGHVDDFAKSFEEELAREVWEETGLKVDPAKFELVASRADQVTFLKKSPHLNTKYGKDKQFVYNTYRLAGIKSSAQLTAGDDALSLYWQPVEEAIQSPRLTPALQESIAKAIIKQ